MFTKAKIKKSPDKKEQETTTRNTSPSNKKQQENTIIDLTENARTFMEFLSELSLGKHPNLQAVWQA